MSLVKPQIVAADDLVAWIRTNAAGSTRFLLGVTGAPGSGKSTLTERLARELDAVVVPMDGFHLSNRELDARDLRAVKGAPLTFDAERFVDAVRDIRRADTDVWLPDFDRAADEPRPDSISVPNEASIVIVEGNYLLLESTPWVELRGLFDTVVHLDIDPALRVERLIDRHVRFGKTPSDASDFVHASDEANAELVEAVRHRAHVIVQA